MTSRAALNATMCCRSILRLRSLGLRRLTALPLVLLALASTPTLGQYGPVDPYAASLRTLVEGVASRSDGEQHAAMVALRQLRDPTLTPLLQRLLRSDDWSLRVDGVLGLGEVDESGMIDVALVGALPGDEDRDAAIAAALELRLADVSRIDAMLAWDDVPALGRAMLAGELRRLGGTPDEALLRRLADSRTPEASAIAAAILLDLGATEAEQAASRVRDVIAATPPRTRSTICAQVAEACSALGLRGAAGFAASLLELPELSQEARMRALGSLLVLEPEVAYPILSKAVDADRSQLSLMRHASILLASGARAPKSEWDRLRNGDPLLEGVADACILISEGRHGEGYPRLLSLRHRVTARAALENAGRGGPSAERALGVACLAALREDRAGAAPIAEPIMRALARLASIAPEELSEALESARTDRELQDALLIVLAGAATPEAARVAQLARGSATRLGEALIAVSEARSAEAVAAETLTLLASAAGGASGVDPATRMQAAWLWVRHAGRINEATSAIVTKLGLGASEAAEVEVPTPKETVP